MLSKEESISYQLHTFGCKVNSYDSGLIEKRLGISEDQRRPQVHILNTCAVTGEATKEAVRKIRRLKREDPDSLVVVTGCSAQVDADAFAQLDEADLVVGNSHKNQIKDLIQDLLSGRQKNKLYQSNIFKSEELGSGGGQETHHTRSFLKIQDGCNSFCTFCIIPFARGKSRSIPTFELVRRVQELYEEGVREVVLTGVHIGDYMDPEGQRKSGPEALLKTLLNQTRIPRFRVSSLEPIELSEELFEIYQDQRMCRHFHISLQSAQSRVLQAMKRKYGHKDVEWALNEIDRRVHGAFVGMDVIAGFPTETEAEFTETIERLRGLPWTQIHSFPYSPREGTYAMRLKEHWPRHVIKARADQLRELSHIRLQQQGERQIGTQKDVLVLRSRTDKPRGVARDYWSVLLPEKRSYEPGQEIRVSVSGVEPSLQMGQPPRLRATLDA